MQSVFMFEQVYLGEQREQCIWNLFKFKLEFEFAIHQQCTSSKWNLSRIRSIYIKFQPSTMCLCIVLMLPHLIVVCRQKLNRNRRLPPSLKTLKLNLVSKASNPTPIDHVDKNPVPSHFLMHDQDGELVSNLTAQLNPYPLHDLSFCHSSKQTTILADIGVFVIMWPLQLLLLNMHVQWLRC